MTATPIAEPLVGRHFVAQHRRPSRLSDASAETLTAYHRCLLVSDGTVAALIEALAREAVVVDCLAQHEILLADPDRCEWLHIRPGTAVVRRQVLIRGTRSGIAYAQGEADLVARRLPPGFVDLLGNEPCGLAGAFAAGQVESRRELLWFGLAAATEVEPEAPREAEPDREAEPELGGEQRTLVRSYRVFVGGRPTLLVTERFPC